MSRIEREVVELAERVQAETGETVEIAYVDQGYTGENAANAAEEHGIKLEVVKLPTAKKGFVLLPRRWAHMLTGAMFSLVSWWLESDKPASPAQMDDVFHQMAWAGISGSLKI
jgi:hypothetical protein